MERRGVRRAATALLLAGALNVGLAGAAAWAKPPEPCSAENDGKTVVDKRGRVWECKGADNEWIRVMTRP